MKNPFQKLNIKKIDLTHLEKYADILFSIIFITAAVYLCMIFYNNFLPLYQLSESVSTKGVVGGSIKIKESELKSIIDNLEEIKKSGGANATKIIRDPFTGQ